MLKIKNKSELFSLFKITTIRNNIISLYILQFSNYILPLITIPYLVRILGPEKFGIVSFGQSLMMYFVLVVNYGFNWSATRAIAMQRNNFYQINKIVSAVFCSKILLTLVSFIVLTLLIFLVPSFRKIYILLYILFGIVVGHALFPQWLFQGLERMEIITIINLTVRILITLAIFVLIRTPNDYFIYAILIALQWLGTGLFGFLWAILALKISLFFPNFSFLKKVFKDGSVMFTTTVARSLVASGNPFLLGILTNDYKIVGYYAPIEKLVRIAQGLGGPISLAFFPYVSHKTSLSKSDGIMLSKKVLYIMMTIGIFISIILFLGAKFIIGIVFGVKFLQSIKILKILAFVPLLALINNALGVQRMLPFKMDRYFLFSMITGAVVNIIFAIILVPIYKGIGMGLSVLIAEAATMFCMIYFLYSKKLRYER